MNFCSKLFKTVVDDKKDQFLTLDQYIARRRPVAHSSLFPANSNRWTISDRDTNACFFFSYVAFIDLFSCYECILMKGTLFH